MTKKLIGLIVLIAFLGTVIYGYILASTPEPVVFQGQLEAKETNIASKVSGRILKVLVQEGEHIEKGTALIRMDDPEIQAKINQAQAALKAAEEQAKKARNGARPEQILQAKAKYENAKETESLATKSYLRIKKLTAEGLISQQKHDEAYTKYRGAQEQLRAAKAQYDLAKEGARSEDINSAEAQVNQVKAKVSEAKIFQDEAQLRSPVAGEISNVIAEEGEIIPKGVPIVSVVDLQNQWLVLNIREDHIAQFALGSEFTGQIPALKNRAISFKVFTSSVMPDFANWRPTRNNQGYDMRTFEVKARPIKPIKDMRPGMSVLVSLKAN